jgi:hypothetical protein
MTPAAIEQLHAELVAVLTVNTDQLQSALRSEIAGALPLESDGYLQFEIDDIYFGITSCATENIILPGDWFDCLVSSDWLEGAEAFLGGWNELIAQKLCPWFADSWQSVGGPAAYSPAYLFFHMSPLDQYDLEQRHWISGR